MLIILIEMHKLTTEEFIKRATAIHGNRYDYSKVNYIDARTKVCIICKRCGCVFYQRPSLHLNGNGCKCNKMYNNGRRLTTEEFIKKAKEVHGDKYDYSKVEYKNTSTKVCIICPEHGEFWQTPNAHLQGHGCRKCSNNFLSDIHYKTTDTFIKECKDVFGDKYDYSKVNYVNNKTKVCIICPEHGEFWQLPYYFLTHKGCPKCNKKPKKNKIKKERKYNGKYRTTEEFINECKKIYGNVFTYEKTKYKNLSTKVTITSPVYGDIVVLPSIFLNGKSMYAKCSKYKKDIIEKWYNAFYKNEDTSEKDYKTLNFINKAKAVHGNFYDYSKVIYNKCNEKITVICPIHGEFKIAPSKHLQGQGCKRCKKSFLEREMADFLERHNINFVQEKFFSWLKMDGYLFYDLYLPDCNIAIECQGEQHYSKNTRWSKTFDITQKRDKTKYTLSKEHNVDIIYFTKKSFYVENEYNKDNTFFKLMDVLTYINKK